MPAIAAHYHRYPPSMTVRLSSITAPHVRTDPHVWRLQLLTLPGARRTAIFEAVVATLVAAFFDLSSLVFALISLATPMIGLSGRSLSAL